MAFMIDTFESCANTQSVKHTMPPAELLDIISSRFSYDEKSGRITRGGLPCGHKESGAGKYLRISIRLWGKNFRIPAHRVAWFLKTKTWPEVIDHINGCPDDNRIDNLRPCTRAENVRNRKRKSGVSKDLPVGVNRQKRPYGVYFRAQVKAGGKTISKTLKSMHEAIQWRLMMEREHYGDFAPNN